MEKRHGRNGGNGTAREINDLLREERQRTQQDFLKKMQEDILDVEDEIAMDDVLADIEEWDSLSFVSFIAMVKVATGKKLNRSVVADAKTIGDLYDFVK